MKEYTNDMLVYANQVLLGRMSGEQAREEMAARQQKALQAKLERWQRVAQVRTAAWERELAR
jgi:hypothetical protein